MTNEIPFWQVDAFSNQPFKGNPAAVFILHTPLSDELMQNIAIEMNLPESAFVLIRQGQNPLLRWFTPVFEIDLCGHATLAAAHIYLEHIAPSMHEVTFDTRFVGPLKIQKTDTAYCMAFPPRPGKEIAVCDIPSSLLDALGTKATPRCAYKARDLMLVYDDEQTIHDINPDFNRLMAHKTFVIVTAASTKSKYDFISRFFCPDDPTPEDPVTGSAHCTLAPYWANALNKNELVAYQASRRGGELYLKLTQDTLFITGQTITIGSGQISI